MNVFRVLWKNKWIVRFAGVLLSNKKLKKISLRLESFPFLVPSSKAQSQPIKKAIFYVIRFCKKAENCRTKILC